MIPPDGDFELLVDCGEQKKKNNRQETDRDGDRDEDSERGDTMKSAYFK